MNLILFRYKHTIYTRTVFFSSSLFVFCSEFVGERKKEIEKKQKHGQISARVSRIFTYLIKLREQSEGNENLFGKRNETKNIHKVTKSSAQEGKKEVDVSLFQVHC